MVSQESGVKMMVRPQALLDWHWKIAFMMAYSDSCWLWQEAAVPCQVDLSLRLFGIFIAVASPISWSKRDSKEESVMPVMIQSQKLHTTTSTMSCSLRIAPTQGERNSTPSFEGRSSRIHGHILKAPQLYASFYLPLKLFIIHALIQCFPNTWIQCFEIWSRTVVLSYWFLHTVLYF